MGKLGWTAYQYYTSSPYEFFAACEGYFDKEKDHMMVIRQATYLISVSMAGSKQVRSAEWLWPISEKKVVKLTEEERRERYERIAKRYNVTRWQKN